MNDIISVVIIDDHTLFRDAVIEVLSSDPRIRVVGQGGTAQEAIDLTRDLHPNLILLDLSLPGGGLNAAAALAKDYPATRIIILTSSESADDMYQATRVGICSYVMKGISSRELIREIYRAYSGDCRDYSETSPKKS